MVGIVPTDMVEERSIEYDTPDDRLPAVSQLEKIPLELGRTRPGVSRAERKDTGGQGDGRHDYGRIA